MKRILILLLFILTVYLPMVYANDTLTVKTKSIEIIKSNWSTQLNVGVSKYSYGSEMKKWLGNHYGPDFNLKILYKNIALGFGFKPWTVNPSYEIDFDGEALPKYAKLNLIKTEITIGYNFKTVLNLSIQPYLGYVNNSFEVINEDVLQRSYDIPSSAGYIVGTNLLKSVFNFGLFNEFQLFLNFNYNIVDFSNVNTKLDNNFTAIELGICFQGWITNTKIID